MSWDKNTINMSNLDAVRCVLDDLNELYALSIISTFVGMGLNDSSSDSPYELRRLRFRDKVILEYVEMDVDCDVDDCIYSEKFNLIDEPQDWVAVRKTDIFCNEEVSEL